MNSFALNVIMMTAIHMTPMKLIFLLMVLVITMFIAIAKTVIKILSNTMNLSMKLLKNGVDGKCVFGIKI